ncbi:MAG: hypothetical protein ACOX6G_09680 [Christensenellales bacterium]|nr:hypothetical protein [Clostridiales bacterium]
MYKLLLITDREDVRTAFESITDWQQLMFHPITICSTVEEGLEHLDSYAVDAMGYCMTGGDVSQLHRYLNEHPSLPVFQTHKHLENVRDELTAIRRFLDRMHMDDTDASFSEMEIITMLRDELMRDLLSGNIQSEQKFMGRVKLARANISLKHHCYLYEFDLPQGEIYMEDTWRYGAERLESALRNNFFKRFVDDIYYDVRVLNPRHIRVIACPRMDSLLTNEETLALVNKHIPMAIQDIKDYLDLDLALKEKVEFDSLLRLISYRRQ